MPALTTATTTTTDFLTAPCDLRQAVAEASLTYPGIPAVLLRRNGATASMPASWCVQQVLITTSPDQGPVVTGVQLHTIEVHDDDSEKQAISALKRLAGAEYGVSAWTPAPGFEGALVPAALAAAMPR